MMNDLTLSILIGLATGFIFMALGYFLNQKSEDETNRNRIAIFLFFFSFICSTFLIYLIFNSKRTTLVSSDPQIPVSTSPITNTSTPNLTQEPITTAPKPPQTQEIAREFNYQDTAYEPEKRKMYHINVKEGYVCIVGGYLINQNKGYYDVFGMGEYVFDITDGFVLTINKPYAMEEWESRMLDLKNNPKWLIGEGYEANGYKKLKQLLNE